jgi:hypothetical protein
MLKGTAATREIIHPLPVFFSNRERSHDYARSLSRVLGFAGVIWIPGG